MPILDMHFDPQVAKGDWRRSLKILPTRGKNPNLLHLQKIMA
jgi:hypothetical protein